MKRGQNVLEDTIERFFKGINGRIFDLTDAECFESLAMLKVEAAPRIEAVFSKLGLEGLIDEFFDGRDLSSNASMTSLEQIYLAKLLIDSGKYKVASGDVEFRLRITPLNDCEDNDL